MSLGRSGKLLRPMVPPCVNGLLLPQAGAVGQATHSQAQVGLPQQGGRQSVEKAPLLTSGTQSPMPEGPGGRTRKHPPAARPLQTLNTVAAPQKQGSTKGERRSKEIEPRLSYERWTQPSSSDWLDRRGIIIVGPTYHLPQALLFSYI